VKDILLTCPLIRLKKQKTIEKMDLVGIILIASMIQ
jgi:hypothetical protein